MSLVGGPKPEPGKVYQEITKALGEEKRIVYNKTTKEFKTVTKDEFEKTYKPDTHYVTKLPELQDAIAVYIAENGISDPQKKDLQNAFEGRAQSLEGKFFAWLGGDELKKAASELRGFKPVIRTAQSIRSKAQQSIPKNISPSSPGPQQQDVGPPPTDLPPPFPPQDQPATQPTTTAEMPKPPSVTTPLIVSKGKHEEEQTAPKPQTPPPQAQPPGASGTPMKTGGTVPPPPPKGGLRPAPGTQGSGGPPPPAAKPKASQTHQNLTKVRPLFEGELPLPQFKEGHDLGKISDIKSPEDRKQYADAIEEYLLGKVIEEKPKALETSPEKAIAQPLSPEEQAKQEKIAKLKAGLQSRQPKQVQREKNGLDSILKSFKEEVAKDVSDSKELERLTEELSDVRTEKKVLEDHQPQMVQANNKGQSYPRKTNDKKEVTLRADSEIEAYTKLTAEEIDAVTKELSAPPQLFSISNQLEIDKQTIGELETKIITLNQSIDDIERQKAARRQKNNNGIPFEKWEQLISDKEDVAKKLNDLVPKLRGTATVEKKEAEVKSDLAMALKKVPELQKTKEELDSLGAAHIGLLKKNPNDFLKSLR